MLSVERDYGTGYVHTTVLHTNEEGYVWIRRPGADRPRPLGHTPERLRQRIGSITGPVVPLLEEPGEARPWLVFRRAGSTAAAAHILWPQEGEGVDLASLLHGTGRLLAALHSLPLPDDVRLPAPAGPERLLRWLRDGTGPRAAGRLHREIAQTLGARRMRAAQEWCAELSSSSRSNTGPGARLLHGSPGTGALTTGADSWPDGVSGALLTGDELARGPAEFDLGWLVGELIESRETVATGDIDFQKLIDHVLAGYGASPDLAAVGRVAALRLFTHAHDFCSYVGWHATVTPYPPLIRDTLDAAADGSLLSAPLETVKPS